MRRRLRPAVLDAGSPECLVRPVHQVSLPGQLSGIGVPGGRLLKLGAQIAGLLHIPLRQQGPGVGLAHPAGAVFPGLPAVAAHLGRKEALRLPHPAQHQGAVDRLAGELQAVQAQQLMAAEREIIEEAYAGDIIGVFDPGIFSIGDTLCAPGKKFQFDPIPTFAPEHFERIRSVDTMKRKQFLKGVEQIAQEGTIQIFKTPYSGMEEVIVGVVGTLQFDVLEYRLRSEYNVELYKEGLPFEYLRWIVKEDEDAPALKEEDLLLPNDAKLVEDYKGNQLLLFASQWSIQWVSDRNKGLKLAEFGGAKF